MAQSQKQRPVILVVEDEFLIRAATADAIREAGFEVLEASRDHRATERYVEALATATSPSRKCFRSSTTWKPIGWP